jgi:acyl carrier protein
MNALESAIKVLIVDTLYLEGINPEDIDSTAPLFGEGLGLDSIDALELGLVLKKRYGIELDANDPATRDHFFSVSRLACMVASYQKA